jgi:hypothetical protein
MVGWSGILARKMSRWFLNNGKSLEFSFLRDFGHDSLMSEILVQIAGEQMDMIV